MKINETNFYVSTRKTSFPSQMPTNIHPTSRLSQERYYRSKWSPKLCIFFCFSMKLGVRSFDSEEELQKFFQSHKKNRDYAVIFQDDGSSGQLNYTIRTRNNNFRTERIYLDNIYEIANRGNEFINQSIWTFAHDFLILNNWFDGHVQFHLQTLTSMSTVDFWHYNAASTRCISIWLNKNMKNSR